MIDKETFKKKFFLRAFSAPVSLIPTGLGLAALMVMIFFGAWSAPVAFLCIVAVAAGLSIAGIRILTQNEKIARELMEEIEKETRANHEKRLDDLEQRLRADGDPRTEALLSDLRTLTASYKEDHSWTARNGGMRASLDVMSDVEKLEEACVSSLEHTLVIHQRGKMMKTRALKEQYLRDRDAVIEDVQGIIVLMGESLGSIQALSTTSGDGIDAARQRAKQGLQDKLRRAERVEARLRDFTKSPRQRAYERLTSS